MLLIGAAYALWMDRSSSSYLITLTLMLVSMLFHLPVRLVGVSQRRSRFFA